MEYENYNKFSEFVYHYISKKNNKNVKAVDEVIRFISLLFFFPPPLLLTLILHYIYIYIILF